MMLIYELINTEPSSFGICMQALNDYKSLVKIARQRQRNIILSYDIANASFLAKKCRKTDKNKLQNKNA